MHRDVLALHAAAGLYRQGEVLRRRRTDSLAERTTLWFEAGVAPNPGAANSDAVKVAIGYLGERRITDNEQANGAVVQAQLTW